jgi:hypothetical protein
MKNHWASPENQRRARERQHVDKIILYHRYATSLFGTPYHIIKFVDEFATCTVTGSLTQECECPNHKATNAITQ